MTCTAVPASGYVTSSISGCSGVPTGSGVNAYTTGVVTANCTVAASFAPVAVVVNAAVPVPALQNWALLMLALSMAGFGWVRMRRSI